MNLFLPSPFWSHNIPLQVSSAAQHGPASHQHGPSFLPSQKMPLQVETSGNVVVVVVGFVVVALVVCHHQNRRCRSPPPPPLLLLVGGNGRLLLGWAGSAVSTKGTSCSTTSRANASTVPAVCTCIVKPLFFFFVFSIRRLGVVELLSSPESSECMVSLVLPRGPEEKGRQGGPGRRAAYPSWSTVTACGAVRR